MERWTRAAAAAAALPAFAQVGQQQIEVGSFTYSYKAETPEVIKGLNDIDVRPGDHVVVQVSGPASVTGHTYEFTVHSLIVNRRKKGCKTEVSRQPYEPKRSYPVSASLYHDYAPTLIVPGAPSGSDQLVISQAVSDHVVTRQGKVSPAALKVTG
jgi:hypothetical protein